MTTRTRILRLMALLAAVATPLLLAAPVMAGDIDDCRSMEQVSNEVRLKACTAVIDGGKADAADLAYAHYRRAMVSSANPNADPAQVMADVSKAIEIDPKLMEAHAFRALAYNRAQQYDEAIADLTTAIELAPDRWGLYSMRAMIYVQKKDTRDGLADYRKALSLNPPATSAQMISQRIAKLEQAVQ